ncbi:MAG: flavodoxin family protein [Desulfobacteraceae bacterium]|jgi:multimeric flavodoxin WrbA|nr:MAG: flavodoxin family protein [Desulfobacteraceae bacterium]
MKILVINGNPKKSGFIADATELVVNRLSVQGVEASLVMLGDARIQDCVGCFQCLKTGNCAIKDDMDDIVSKMLQTDGYVMISAVRNSDVTACYKRFYERITYRLGFPLLLENKHTLAISAVGYMGGKSVNRRLLGLQDVCNTSLSGHLHFAVGIPARPMDHKIRARITSAVDRLVEDIRTRKDRSIARKASYALDRFVLKRFVFRSREDVYANVLRHWKDKGYLS